MTVAISMLLEECSDGITLRRRIAFLQIRKAKQSLEVRISLDYVVAPRYVRRKNFCRDFAAVELLVREGVICN